MSKLFASVTSLVLSLLFTMTAGLAQEMDLSVDKIPDSLKTDAFVVTRYEKEVFEVTSIERATFKVRSIITILNERGDDELVFQHWGDKFHKLGDFELKVYDANGKFVIKYKKKDLSTYNIGEGLVDDGIRHYLVVPAASYPITIETEYDEIFKGLLGYPAYHFASPYKSVMASTFTAIVPKENGLRFKQQNTTLQPVKTDDGKNLTYTWSANNQVALTYEDGATASGKCYPAILLAPNKFKLDDYEGDMSSWKNYGLWYASVIAGTDKLNEQKISFYRDLVKDASTNREKIRTVYQYMQTNFRYVSIQLGIGGHRPLPASFTDDKKYGDCKGLSNYMYAVLKTLGIKSHLVVIRSQANDDGEDPDFPIDRFNHVILFVPEGKDSIWLECTSKTLPFGTLDHSTLDKNAVIITENGGILVATPKSRSAENLLFAKTTIELNETGSGECISNIQASGLFKQIMLSNISERKRDDQKSFLVRYFGYKQPDELTITQIADPYIYNTNIELTIEKVSEFTAGSKMFLAPHIYKFWNYKMPENENRIRDFYFNIPFTKSDTTIYKLPQGFIIDMLPAARHLSSEVAEYRSAYFYNEGEKAVYCIVKLELKRHKIAPVDYSSTKEFFDKVLKEESQRIVIKKDPNYQQQLPPRKAGF
jgi:hypothetical protein